MDSGAPAPPTTTQDSDEDEDEGSDEDASEHNEEGADDDADEDPRPPISTSQPAQPTSKSRKPSAWDDPDDTTLTVSLAANKRLRKLRDDVDEDAVGGREYERRLRRQFERINPTPTWATAARKKLKKRRRESDAGEDGEEGEDVEDAVESLLTTTGGIIDGVKKGKPLEKGNLSIERLRDANQSAKAEGEVKAIHFHPSPRIPVLLVASADRRVRLFNVSIHGLLNRFMFLTEVECRSTATVTPTSKPFTSLPFL